MKTARVARHLNLVLIVAFPVAWFAPLLRTSLLPQWKMPEWLGGNALFSPDTLTVVSGVLKLWETDVFLAVAVTFFALVAPMVKCIGLSLVHYELISPEVRPYLAVMGKLAMADIFLVALYIVIAKGIGIGTIEVAWGLYLFTASVIASMLVSVFGQGKQPA